MDMVLKGEDLQALGFSDSLYVTSKRIPRSGARTKQEIEIDATENSVTWTKTLCQAFCKLAL